MSNPLEVYLRKGALVLTVLLALQLAWSAARLVLLEAPEPIPPADSALRIEAILESDTPASAETPELVSRPLFWPGREPFVPVEEVEEPEPAQPAGNAETLDLKLLGVYSAGANSGIIVQHKGERRRVLLDESVDGWRFILMSGDGAVFKNGDETRTLLLEHVVPKAEAKGRGGSAARSRRVKNNTVNRQEGD